MSFLLTVNKLIHLGPSQSFRYLLDVWKDDFAFRVLGKFGRSNEFTFLSSGIKWENAKTLNETILKCKNQTDI